MRNVTKAVLAMVVAGAPMMVHAGPVIFADNFDGDTPALNAIVPGWSVTGGTVDIVANGSFGIGCAGNSAACIDLDGSTRQSGTMTTSPGLSLTAGQTYTAFFDLSGNDRTPESDTVSVTFGTSTASFSFAQNDPFSTKSVTFTPSSSGVYTLSFLDSSADDYGAILDNVSVQAVPEPATYAMLLLGLGLIGVGARRKVAVAATQGLTRQ